MPRIPDRIAECSIYLYETERAAKEGQNSGGSGFLVHVPSNAHGGYGHLYAVTNRHIVDNGFQVLRLSRKSGGIETITTQPDAWIRHPKYDVAVNAVEFSPESFTWWSVQTDDFITEELVRVYNIGLGDEAFLVGRLIGHAGKQKNSPVTRFGTISLMVDDEELIQCGDYEQPGFLVECRSLSGFSGSPVFVTTTQTYCGEDAERIVQFEAKGGIPALAFRGGKAQRFPGQVVLASLQTTAGPWLLGIDWGHIPLSRPVFENDLRTKTDYRVEANTGIACVLPAWHVLECLNDEELVKQRREEDRKQAKQLSTE